jgi:hypothetical protein
MVDFKNLGHVKVLLLSQGVYFTDSVLEEVGKKYSENRYYYSNSNKLDTFKKNLPPSIFLPDNIEANLYFNPESKLSIQADEEGLALFWMNKYICPVEFNIRPNFFDKLVDQQIQCKQVLSMYARFVLGIFSNGYCYFFHDNCECQFCSLMATRKQLGKENLFIPTAEIVSKALKIALATDGERIKYINYTSGTHRNEEESYLSHAEMIAALSEVTHGRCVHHLNIMPTKKNKLLFGLKKAGLNSLSFALEVFDKDLFKEYCPGKERFVGYDHFFECYKIARDIFDHGQVYAGFVGGLEPLESLEKGLHFLGEMGISHTINIFHPDPDTPLAKRARPTVEYLLNMAKLQSAVYKKYQFKPLFMLGGRRSSLDVEAYRGFFD